MTETQSTTTAVVIAGVTIYQDAHGRYNLNKLHEASHTSEAKRPGQWLKRKSTQELIKELDSQMSFSTSDVVKGGEASGTYVHELLAVSYAGWVSPAFQLKVNQAFLDMKQGHAQPITRGDLLVQMAEAYRAQEQRLVAIEEAHKAQQDQRLEDQAALIRSLQQAQRAEDKADVAEEKAVVAEQMAREAVNATGRQTLEEFVFGNRLLHQFPGKMTQDGHRIWPVEVNRLKGYCQAYGFEILKVPVTGKPWATENGYPVQALAWLAQHPTTKTQLTLVKEGMPAG